MESATENQGIIIGVEELKEVPVCDGLNRNFVRPAGHLIQVNSFTSDVDFGVADWHAESLFLWPACECSLK